jgi:hypothetical protein
MSRDFPTEQEYDSLNPDNFWVSSLRERAAVFADLAASMSRGYDDFSSSDWDSLRDSVSELGIWDAGSGGLPMEQNLRDFDEPFSYIDDSDFASLQNHFLVCEQYWEDMADDLSGWRAFLPPYRDLTRSAWAEAVADGRKSIPFFDDFLDSELG